MGGKKKFALTHGFGGNWVLLFRAAPELPQPALSSLRLNVSILFLGSCASKILVIFSQALWSSGFFLTAPTYYLVPDQLSQRSTSRSNSNTVHSVPLWRSVLVRLVKSMYFTSGGRDRIMIWNIQLRTKLFRVSMMKMFVHAPESSCECSCSLMCCLSSSRFSLHVRRFRNVSSSRKMTICTKRSMKAFKDTFLGAGTSS